MEAPHHIRHYHHHFGMSYAVSLRQRVYSFIIIPLLVLLVIFFVQTHFTNFSYAAPTDFTIYRIVAAVAATFVRLLAAYVLALIASIPLSLLVTQSPTAERIFLPAFDIMESIPALAFFPIIVAFFLHYNLFDGAAIFILFLAMVWNIVFSVVGGLRVIPTDIKSAAQIFHLTGLSYVRKVMLPAVVPYLVTGSLLAWAQGWNIIIVAEVLHTYIPGGTPSQDLFGIGSVLVNASATGQQQIFLLAIVVMIFAIGLMNFFIWQKLLHYAERFKFE